MHDSLIQLTLGDREVEVTGWQATLIGVVLIGMPWVLGIVSIVRAAMYGW